jgi:hypothetical protein
MKTFLEAKTIQQQLGKCEGWSTKYNIHNSTEYNIHNPLIYTDHAVLAG